jgi:methylglyoxal synthase
MKEPTYPVKLNGYCYTAHHVRARWRLIADGTTGLRLTENCGGLRPERGTLLK